MHAAGMGEIRGPGVGVWLIGYVTRRGAASGLPGVAACTASVPLIFSGVDEIWCQILDGMGLGRGVGPSVNVMNGWASQLSAFRPADSLAVRFSRSRVHNSTG